MTDRLIAATAEALGGAPTELVRRSAAARAQAQGIGIDEVLQAWAGGGTATATAAPEPPAAEIPAPAPVPEAATKPAPGPAEAGPAPAAETAPSAPAVPQAVGVTDEEPVEPAPLAARVGFAVRVGAIIGLLAGIVFALGASPLLLERATVLGEDPLRPAVEVNLTWFIVVTAVVFAVFGALAAIAGRTVPGWFHPDMTLRGTARSGWFAGAIVGAVAGAIGAPLATGLVGETLETGVVLDVRAGVIVLVLGSSLVGALVAAVAQLFGEPARLPVEVEAEAREVKHRLAGGVVIPLAALAAIALLVLPFALLLFEFHGVAPLLAIVAAGGIVAFAFLAAYRPGMHITAGEFILAAVGIGIVLLVIALVVLAQQEPGGHEEGSEALLAWLTT